MIRAKKHDELVTYVGHVIHPHITCTGTVEIWDQTIGCPECQKELWTGDTREDEFHAEHPFIFEDCHDDGDSHWAEDAFRPDIPLGGWRLPWLAPQWHNAGYYMPGASDYLQRAKDGTITEHVFPADMWSNHDPGDV